MHDLPALKRACRVSDEDLCDMIQEVKRLNPKPGLKYGVGPVAADRARRAGALRFPTEAGMSS